MVTNPDHLASTRAVVYFSSESEVLVGQAAYELRSTDPRNYVERIKRVMGDDEFLVAIQGREYRPELIAAFIYAKLKENAESLVGTPVTQVTLTVPAYWGVAGREAALRAGHIAGLDVQAIISEPIATAIAYTATDPGDHTLLIYDLGGSSLDLTVVRIVNGQMIVVCVVGDTDLGGRDWDVRVATHLAEVWKTQTASQDNPLDDLIGYWHLLDQAEAAKRMLTYKREVELKIQIDGRYVSALLSREKFDELTSDLVSRTVGLVQEIMAEASTQGMPSVDKILLTGGSSHMPQVQDRLRAEFPTIEQLLFEPDYAAVIGAALYGSEARLGRLGHAEIACARDVTGNDNAIELRGWRYAKPESTASHRPRSRNLITRLLTASTSHSPPP